MPSAFGGVETAMKTISEARTPAAMLVVKVSLPAAAFLRMISSRPGS